MGESSKMINNNLIDKRYQNFCDEIFRIANEEHYDYFIFVSRKCYYYTKIVCEMQGGNNQLSPFSQKVQEIRDRDLLKEMDFSIFESKKILLVDDTLYTGNTVLKIIERMMKKIKHVTIGIAVFAVVADAVPLFFKNSQFASYNKMCLEIFSYAQMSEFVIRELQVIQESGHSYVIDLPVFKEIQISEDYFDKLIKEKNAGWLFTKYEVNIKGRSYNNGFFLYDNKYMKKVLGDALIDLVIKCRYERKVSDDGQRLVFCRFTPFAILRSMEYEEVWGYFSSLFANTEYLNCIQNGKREVSTTDDYVTIYRSVIYTLSYFTGKVFQTYTKNLIGEKPELLKNLSEIDLNILFAKGIDQIFSNFSILNFYKYLPSIQPGQNQEYEIAENNLPIDMKTIETWFMEWISMHKRDYLLDEDAGKKGCQTITIEEIEKKLDDQFLFSTKNQLQNSLICIILKALDTGMLSNYVMMEKNKILRCFKMGETSDILSEYDISVFYAAIYSYYNHIGSTDEKYQQYYDQFIKALKGFLFNNGYFENKYISEKEFDFLADYFKMEGDVLKREIMNKRYVLSKNLKSEKRHIKDIMDFVYCLQLNN